MATLAISGAALFKAGANVSTALTEAHYDYALLQAEGYINSITKYNWVDAYGTLSVDTKYILEDACSDLAAMYIINYDMSGYTSRSEAQTMLDILRDRASTAIKELKDIKVRDFVIGET